MTTITMPDSVSISVYTVIISNLFAGLDGSYTKYVSTTLYGSDITIRNTAMVYMALRVLHQYHFAITEVIAMVFILSQGITKRTICRHHPTIVDSQNARSRRNIYTGIDAISVNWRSINLYN
jgi:hypothetical protein